MLFNEKGKGGYFRGDGMYNDKEEKSILNTGNSNLMTLLSTKKKNHWKESINESLYEHIPLVQSLSYSVLYISDIHKVRI